MSLLEKYQLFLFDFDGLLVDTERLHMEAYKLLCRKYGYELPWSFAEYQVIAHGSAHGLQQALSEKLGGRWEDRYVEKRTLYRQLLEKGEVTLMPGAAALLQTLAARNIKRAVVTHSPKEHLQMVRARLPILNTIPHWIGREDYVYPKPSPECYLKAIRLFAAPGELVIGFEDSARGLQALQGTSAQPVFVGSSFKEDGRTLHLNSLEDLLTEVPV
ncbi:MAG: HAD family phosphatase [Verrucomicrobia bacterium]|nr:HAD family phosphatase [Verrucomicrobiota bacterium]